MRVKHEIHDNQALIPADLLPPAQSTTCSCKMPHHYHLQVIIILPAARKVGPPHLSDAQQQSQEIDVKVRVRGLDYYTPAIMSRTLRSALTRTCPRRVS